MPLCEARAYREPDGQYSWVYFKDSNFQEVGGANLTLSACFNAIRDKIAAEANVTNTKTIELVVNIP